MKKGPRGEKGASLTATKEPRETKRANLGEGTSIPLQIHREPFDRFQLPSGHRRPSEKGRDLTLERWEGLQTKW